MVEKTFYIISDTGIHARPATSLVNMTGQFSSDIIIKHNGKEANLKSIMGVMAMGIQKGSEVVIKAEGSDSEEAMKAIEKAMNNGGLCKS